MHFQTKFAEVELNKVLQYNDLFICQTQLMEPDALELICYHDNTTSNYVTQTSHECTFTLSRVLDTLVM